MSLLTLIKQVANEVGLPEPTLVIGSTDQQVRQLLAHTHRVGDDLCGMFQWPRLTKRGTITLVASQAAYALPSDWDYDLNDTHWSQSQFWPMLGPLTPVEWEHIKNGISTVGTQMKFRIFGFGDATFTVEPTPSTADAGNILVYEYQSKNWIRPKTWTTGTVFAAGTYCFYNGYYFYTSAGGTTGATAPTPSALNDGGVVWTSVTDAYDEFLADTDVSHLDEGVVALGVEVGYLAAKGLPYAHLAAKYNADARTAYGQQKGARVLSLSPQPNSIMLTPWNLPDTGYGTP
jgi:hypothetical protein